MSSLRCLGRCLTRSINLFRASSSGVNSSLNPSLQVCARRSYSSDMQQQFEEAKSRLNTLTEDPGNEVKLQLYALFKQATSGRCNTKEPGMFDLVGKAKWKAWSGLGDLSQDDARQQYIDTVNKLAGDAPPPPAKSSNEPSRKASVDSNGLGMDIVNKDGLLQLTFNRPAKKNAITWKMYKAITTALTDAANDDSVRIAVLTGTGEYYSSGNDLSNFAKIPPEGAEKMAEDGQITLKEFTHSFINFPKPLIAAVNGPAIGIPVTTLGLCDLVYASDTATFHTPFMNLGQSPEGCSSYTFPKIMGYAKANDILLRGRKFTAQEALDWGLVAQVFPHDSFNDQVKARVDEMLQMPPKSLRYSKALLRGVDIEELNKINDLECERLRERWLSEECMAAIMNFFQKRSKV